MDAFRRAAVTLMFATRSNNYLAVASLTLLYYDFCLTFTAEVERFWKTARLSLFSALFVLNRYLGLLGPIPVMLEYFGSYTPQRCRQLQRYHQYYAILCQSIIGVILIIRTFALYGRNKRLLVALLALAIALAVFTLLMNTLNNAIGVSSPNTVHLARTGMCDLSLTLAQGLRPAVGWICMVLVDTVIFALTLVKALTMRDTLKGGGLLHVLFRDGTIYYGILVAASVANLITFLVPDIGDANRGLGTTLANTLATTLVSRIFLNLRNPHLRPSVRMIGRRGERVLPHRWRLSDQTCGSAEVSPSTLHFQGLSGPGCEPEPGNDDV